MFNVELRSILSNLQRTSPGIVLDMLILEFTLNDAGGKSGSRNWYGDVQIKGARCMEAIVMQMKTFMPNCLVVFLQLTSLRFLKTLAAHPTENAVAAWYGIPQISLHSGILHELVTKDYSNANSIFQCGGCGRNRNAACMGCRNGTYILRSCRPELCDLRNDELDDRTDFRDHSNRHRIQKKLAGLLVFDDMHLGCEGHDLVADMIANFLLTSQLHIAMAASYQREVFVNNNATDTTNTEEVARYSCCATRSRKNDQEQFDLANWITTFRPPFQESALSKIDAVPSGKDWHYNPNYHRSKAWLHGIPTVTTVIPEPAKYTLSVLKITCNVSLLPIPTDGTMISYLQDLDHRFAWMNFADGYGIYPAHLWNSLEFSATGKLTSSWDFCCRHGTQL
eukprot:m.670559 g.670559  ORF g.670559 m.670559 type:complete len:394 (+) comp22765_c0_seq62:675-1856(+)